MFNFFKNPKFPIKIFIAASFASFILFLLFASLFKSMLLPEKSGDAYFLKETAGKSDPFITKVPNLKDVLAGPILSDADPSLGSKNAPVTIVEFSDFQCEFCQRQEEILKNVIKEYGDSVRLIWKDYPEADLNSISFKASQAARCADKQGKFWPYHDLLFSADSLNDEQFLVFAEELKLDKSKFKKCLGDESISEQIADNMLEANALGISGIPYTFVNDLEIMGEITAEELKNAINSKLKN